MKVHICPDGCLWSYEDLIFLAGIAKTALTEKTRARRLSHALVQLARGLKSAEQAKVEGANATPTTSRIRCPLVPRPQLHCPRPAAHADVSGTLAQSTAGVTAQSVAVLQARARGG